MNKIKKNPKWTFIFLTFLSVIFRMDTWVWCFHAQFRDQKITISFNIIISLFEYRCLDFAFESVTSQEEATVWGCFFFLAGGLGWWFGVFHLVWFFSLLGLKFRGFCPPNEAASHTGQAVWGYHLANRLKSFCPLPRGKMEKQGMRQRAGEEVNNNLCSLSALNCITEEMEKSPSQNAFLHYLTFLETISSLEHILCL